MDVNSGGNGGADIRSRVSMMQTNASGGPVSDLGKSLGSMHRIGFLSGLITYRISLLQNVYYPNGFSLDGGNARPLGKWSCNSECLNCTNTNIDEKSDENLIGKRKQVRAAPSQSSQTLISRHPRSGTVVNYGKKKGNVAIPVL